MQPDKLDKTTTQFVSLPRDSNISLEISPKLLGNPDLATGQSAAKNVECKYDPEYLIYEDGRVYSKKAKRFLTGKIDNVGYRVYSLAIINPLTGKKGKMMYAHRLVAEHFIPNPDNLPYVHHKDENKLNNHVSNLQWVTAKENNAEHRKMQAQDAEKVKRPRYKIKDLTNEEWMIIQENPLYSISNKGRVKNNKTHRILVLDDYQTYTRISLNTKKHYYVHRLVYCTFHNDYDLDGYVIDHIDNNPRNNCLENLQKITTRENNLRQKRFQH